MNYKNLIVTGLLAGSLALGGCNSENLEQKILRKTQFVTKPIVKKAVENFCDSHIESAWGANTAARHTVFENEIGDNWFYRLYGALAGSDFYAKKIGRSYEPFLVNCREHIMKSTRDYLKNPDNLMMTYTQNKGSILETIKEKGRTGDIIKMLDSALSGEDQYTNEFLERRKAEGGDELVSTYQRIFQDLR